MTWLDDAACLGMSPDPWFSENPPEVAYAKSVCAKCPVRVECLDEAITKRIHHGTWGGLTARERRRVRRKALEGERRREERIVTDFIPLMHRMADGDDAAAWEFYDRYRRTIGALVVKLAKQRGAFLPRGEVDGLAMDFVIELRRLAGGWDVDKGAAPWTWAFHRLVNIVERHVGDGADREFMDEIHLGYKAPAAVTYDWHPLDVLERLALTDDRCSEFLSTLVNNIPTERDRRLYVEVLVEKSTNNPAPLALVADMLGINHATARKAYSRARRRMEAA